MWLAQFRCGNNRAAFVSGLIVCFAIGCQAEDRAVRSRNTSAGQLLACAVIDDGRVTALTGVLQMIGRAGGARFRIVTFVTVEWVRNVVTLVPTIMVLGVRVMLTMLLG